MIIIRMRQLKQTEPKKCMVLTGLDRRYCLFFYALRVTFVGNTWHTEHGCCLTGASGHLRRLSFARAGSLWTGLRSRSSRGELGREKSNKAWRQTFGTAVPRHPLCIRFWCKLLLARTLTVDIAFFVGTSSRHVASDLNNRLWTGSFSLSCNSFFEMWICNSLSVRILKISCKKRLRRSRETLKLKATEN